MVSGSEVWQCSALRECHQNNYRRMLVGNLGTGLLIRDGISHELSSSQKALSLSYHWLRQAFETEQKENPEAFPATHEILLRFDRAM